MNNWFKTQAEKMEKEFEEKKKKKVEEKKEKIRKKKAKKRINEFVDYFLISNDDIEKTLKEENNGK